jgi:tRNA pseudouridine13 synthase
MKLKFRPDDFRVEELPIIDPSDDGRYTVYRLVKKSIGTIEAVQSICQRWNLAGRRVSYGGLKDRHADTIQYLTIADGPAKSLHEKHFELIRVGKSPKPYGPDSFRGNRFEIVLRDLDARAAQRAAAEVAHLADEGLPNYFDDQRFGSVGHSKQFIAHAWLRGDHERALFLALAEPNSFDRSALKSQKAVIRDLWGKWREAKARLERSSARSIVTYLVDHPTDFRGAFARLKRELRTLYFSAFQSHLWNMILGRWIERWTRPEERVPVALKMGTLPFPRGIDADRAKALAATTLPLPCARTPAPEGPLRAAVDEVLESFQLCWEALRVKHLKDVFFSKGSRACLVFPEKVEHAILEDEFHRGRLALRLSFELARGSYATILVKRITNAVEQRAHA